VSEADDAIAKIEEQLAWRGPSDRKMGHVVLKRELAEQLVLTWRIMEVEAKYGEDT